MTITIDAGQKKALRTLLSRLTDEEKLLMLNELLGTLEFKGTITTIRELVNDPKWDDKV